MSRTISISVIIPTYKRPESTILRVLKSLQKQTLADFEIILVDNACNPKLKTKIQNFNKTARIPTIYIEEPNMGFHSALHNGAIKSSSPLLFFTNDDVTLNSRCLEVYVKAFNTYPDMTVCGGPIIPKWETPPSRWITNLIGESKVFPPYSLMKPHKKFKLSKDGFFFGTNMAMRKITLFSLGGFNPEMFGNIILGDGETGLTRKLWKKNLPIGYIPKAIVYHHIPKNRMTLEYLLHWHKNVGCCDMYTLFHERKIPKNWLELIPFIIPFIYINAKYWLGNLFFKGQKAPLGIRIKLQLARTKSQLEYTKRLMTDKTLQKLVSKKNWLQ